MRNAAGIDYGHGQANIDPANGIRYGVISQNTVSQAWAECSEGYYGEANCPKCGQPAKSYDDETGCEYGIANSDIGKCHDYQCDDCRWVFESQEAFSDEALSYTYEQEGYVMCSCLLNDIMIVRSPYYTFARFCSPCVPGAGNLDDWDEDNGVMTYCLNHDWFPEGKAPYPVFRVADDKVVEP